MKPFIPELEQLYYYISQNDEIEFTNFRQERPMCIRHLKTGNCYPTIETARYHRDMEIKSWQIRQFAFEPDWSDFCQIKIYMLFDHKTKEIGMALTFEYESSKTYFESRETARAAFADVSKDDFLYMQSRGMI